MVQVTTKVKKHLPILHLLIYNLPQFMEIYIIIILCPFPLFLMISTLRRNVPHKSLPEIERLFSDRHLLGCRLIYYRFTLYKDRLFCFRFFVYTCSSPFLWSQPLTYHYFLFQCLDLPRPNTSGRHVIFLKPKLRLYVFIPSKPSPEWVWKFS